jgi:hypothetical protein
MEMAFGTCAMSSGAVLQLAWQAALVIMPASTVH